MELIQVPGCEKERNKINEACGNPFDKNKATCPNTKAFDTADAEHKAAVKMRPKGPKRDAAKKAATAKKIRPMKTMNWTCRETNAQER